MAQTWAFRSFASNNSDSTSLTINKPSGCVEDDLLVAVITNCRWGQSSTQPSGWTREISDNEINFEIGAFIDWKVAGGSEPSSYSWTSMSNWGACGIIACYSGFESTTTADVSGSSQANNANQRSSPSVTTTVDDCLVVRLVSRYEDVAFTTFPSDNRDLEYADYFQDGGCGLSDGHQATAGATGAATWEWSGNYAVLAATVAFQQAGPAVEKSPRRRIVEAKKPLWLPPHYGRN